MEAMTQLLRDDRAPAELMDVYAADDARRGPQRTVRLRQREEVEALLLRSAPRRTVRAGRPAVRSARRTSRTRRPTMLIAFLALLGVDLIVLIVFVAFVLGRRRWVRSQAGAFPCAIRVAQGDIDGLGSKWHRGYGRWVRDVFVWTKAPLLFRNQLMAADGLDGQRPARQGEVKRLGDNSTVIHIRQGDAVAAVAARGDDASRLLGPYQSPPEVSASAGSPATAASEGRERT
jgi:hypothetical protein